MQKYTVAIDISFFADLSAIITSLPGFWWSQDELTEYVYAAELAGLGYSLANTKCGITLAIKVS